MKINKNIGVYIGLIILAILLPMLLKTVNKMVRFSTGAEGRLAAITVDTNRELGPLNKPWSALAQGGEEQNVFLTNNATEVANLKPGYIRLDHIYDNFGVVSRKEGKLVFNWANLDKVVKQVLEMKAKPFLVLSYMPQELATTDLVSEPKDWNEWSFLVQKTVEHFSGEMKIQGMYYEVWNEPDLFGKWTMGGKKDYRKLYLYSVKGAVASGLNNFKIGGPATSGFYPAWADGLLKWSRQNDLRMDFLSWHRYDLNIDRYDEDVNQAESALENNPYLMGVEKIITEYGPNSNPGGVNDNEIGAAHLVAVQRALLGKVSQVFSFAVSGQWGIIDRPRYDALKMLSSLGDKRMPLSGEGSWVRAIAAKNGSTYQALLANYDAKGVHSENVPVTFINLKANKFVLNIQYLDGRSEARNIATDEAILQQHIPLTPNSVVLLELTPVNIP